MHTSVDEVSRVSSMRGCKLLFSNFKTEKELSTVAIDTGKVANVVSSVRMFGEQSALQSSSDDSESCGVHGLFLLKQRRSAAKIEVQSSRRV